MLREDLELHLSDAISLMSADRKLCGSPSCRQCLVYTALATSNILKRAKTCAIANTKSFLQVLRYFMIFCAVSSSKVTFTELGRKEPWGREMADDDNGTCALTKVGRIWYFIAWNIVNPSIENAERKWLGPLPPWQHLWRPTYQPGESGSLRW